MAADHVPPDTRNQYSAFMAEELGLLRVRIGRNFTSGECNLSYGYQSQEEEDERESRAA